MKKYYLYAIFNTINCKMYFGITCNPKRRWSEHKKFAKHIKKHWSRAYAIHFAMAKYGIDKFIFKLIDEIINIDNAKIREIEIIKIAKECKFQLYNETNGGDSGPNTAATWTEERKKHMSKIMSGSGNPMYGVQLFGPANGNFGKPMKPHVKKTLLEYRCKLTPEQVENIRQLYSTGNYTQTALSKRFHISLTQVHRIITGQRWNKEKSNHKIKPNLKPEQVIEIRRLYNSNNYTQMELSQQYNISITQISKIINYHKWKNI